MPSAEESIRVLAGGGVEEVRSQPSDRSGRHVESKKMLTTSSINNDENEIIG